MTESVFFERLGGLGERMDLPGNQRLVLDSPDELLILVSGRMEVFAVDVSGGGGDGPRRHLFTLLPGHGSPGLTARRDGVAGDMTLLAVAAEPSTVLRLSAAAVFADEALAVETLDRTLEPILRAIAERDPQQINAVVESEATVTATPGQKFGSRSVPVWALIDQAVDFEGIPVVPRNGSRPLPLAGGAWMEVDSEGEIEFVDSAGLGAHGGYEAGWRSFTDLLSDYVVHHAAQQDRDEAEQLRARGRANERLQASAMRELLEIVVPKTAQAVPVGEGGALLEACKTVGAAAGIRIRNPPRWGADLGTANPLTAILAASRIRSRQVALRGEWWSEDAGPILAYRGAEKSPVALIPKGRRYHLHDPVTGEQVPVDASIRDELEPFGYTFYRTLPDHELGIWELFRFGFEGLSWSFGSIALLATMAGLLGLFMPIATGFVFNSVIPSANPNQLFQVFVGLTVAVASGVAFELTRGFVVIRMEAKGGTSMQAALFDRLLKLPARFFRRFSIGDLVSRVGGIGQVQSMLSGTAVTAILGGLTASFNLALIFYYDWRLALFGVVWVGLALSIVATLAWLAIRTQSDVQDHAGRLSGFVLQLINGIAKIRLAGAENRALAQWGHRYAAKVKLERKAAGIQAWVTVFNDLLPLLTSLVLFGGVGFLVSRGHGMIETAAFIAFNAALGSFMAAAISTSNTLISLVQVVPLMHRARPILVEQPEVALDKPDPGAITGRIEGRHLDFRYDPDGPLILKDVSFETDPGDFVAFVGPSGSGKSTALRLLLGFEQPESGGVYYDGQELASVDVSAIRRQMGVVLQTSRLMSGDIFTNIVGSAPLTIDDAWEAAEMAGVADDIREMPMGMHTVVSEGGGTLSGGQRQRLLIARALATKPRVILFDEATSALDNRTQSIVSRSLENMHAARIVIAHRLSTIQKAKCIYVMVAGEVVETGDYDELMSRDGVFQKLAARQLA